VKKVGGEERFDKVDVQEEINNMGKRIKWCDIGS
jgi:hypothetical protein